VQAGLRVWGESLDAWHDSVSGSGLTGEDPRISLMVMVWLLLVRDRALDYGRVVTCGCPPARAGLVR